MNEEQFVNIVSQMLLNTGYAKTRDALLEETKTHGFKITKKEIPLSKDLEIREPDAIRRAKCMVYIIQCLSISSKNYSKEKLEEYRQDFMKQIKEGCLLLPGAFKLVDVANTDVDSIVSMEIKPSYSKAEIEEEGII